MKIKNRITRIIEEEKLLSGDDTFVTTFCAGSKAIPLICRL